MIFSNTPGRLSFPAILSLLMLLFTSLVFGQQITPRAALKPESRARQAQDPQLAAHRDTIQALMTNGKKIRRSVELLPDGIRSRTESDDPEIAALLKTHVPQMYQFVKEGKAVRRWDPLFREIFKNGDKIKMTVEETEKGVKVTETSTDEKVVALIQEHSKIIDNFVATGWDSAAQEHPVPAKAKREK